MFILQKARDSQKDAIQICKEVFIMHSDFQDPMDAQFIDFRTQNVFGVTGISYQRPVCLEILKNEWIRNYLKGFFDLEKSVLLVFDVLTKTITIKISDHLSISSHEIPGEIASLLVDFIIHTGNWVGHLNEKGEHITNLVSPPPGPHFHVNLLMGNRIGFEAPLLTTPKSVVDRLGRGSFRSHAGTQVLATKWDYLPEENGFPANRQFYLVEEGKQIFYSANPQDERIEEAFCLHGQNHTVITYKTICGLEIERIIFLLPHQEGMPLATEVQRIHIKNTSGKNRTIKIIYTGMLGTSAAAALAIDVVYSTLIMQASILKTENGEIAAISFDNNPDYLQEDLRYHSMLIHGEKGVSYPDEFTTHYTTFVGSGSLERPQGIQQLNNQLSRKGPGFFALAKEMTLHTGENCTIDNFTGLVSAKCQKNFDESVLAKEVNNLLSYYATPEHVVKSFEQAKNFGKTFSTNMQIQSESEELNAYFNNNLPFQVLYQTFVSRSFGWTQKGYREIGFREIQDIYASMYYFVGMGQQDLVKKLMQEWIEHVYEEGYANHNFYWVGKEPGRCSDDALWLSQAVDRYIELTGDYDFLMESFEMAERNGNKRSVYKTFLAIIHYSNDLSVGHHGLPLLDHSDWNDCLQLDFQPISPGEKIKQYRQLNPVKGEAIKHIDTDQSESVMNAFLLKIAIDVSKKFAIHLGDLETGNALEKASTTLNDNIQKYCWKEDYFARVLFNRVIEGEITFLGAGKDGLSSDRSKDGTYFINSFTWAVLSGAVTEAQIETMLVAIEKHLKTPYGLLLCTQVDYKKVCSEASSAHYFVGDRENGAVFKHANMMAASAMLKAAQNVASNDLARRLTELAYWTIDQVLPYKTMENPYLKAGNPRLCTQYNNSQTGEGIGPVLSGTSTWLIFAMMEALGIHYVNESMALMPLMRPNEKKMSLNIQEVGTTYHITIEKPLGFYRIKDSAADIYLDEKLWGGAVLPRLKDGKSHEIRVVFKASNN